MSAVTAAEPTTAPEPRALPAGVLAAVVGDVWALLLGDPVDSASAAAREAPAAGVRASVAVTGAWDGRVALACSPAAADDLARAVLALDPDEPVAAADVADAVGELANVLGGGVKASLPGPSQLGLPVVAVDGQPGDPAGQPAAQPAEQARGRLVDHLALTWRGHRVAVTVTAAAPAAPESPSATQTAGAHP